MHANPSAFRALHEPGQTFIIPNPWDRGTAQLFCRLGFPALATTSAGYAFSCGKDDGDISFDENLAHVSEIVDATPLPVSADLEMGLGDSPESAAETIRRAAAVGLAGCSIEDYSGNDDRPIYEFNLAVERVAAAVEAVRSLDTDFVFTARAENFLHGVTDLDDTIARLQAFEDAGADVLYAPGLRDIETIRTVCSTVSKPVNAVAGLGSASFTVAELREAGVCRISLGSSLSRFAFGSLRRAAREILDQGTFNFASEAMSFPEMSALMADGPEDAD